MPDWSKKFKAEYDDIRTRISNPDNFAEDWRPLIRRLQKLCTDTGFDASQVSALTELRTAVTWGEKGMIGHKTTTEDLGILRAVTAAADDVSGTVEARKRLRAAALKLLRHVYLVNQSGNRKAWVVSLPTELQAWPTDDFHSRATTLQATRTMLRANSEIFSREDRKHLAQSTRHGLAWCQRTLIELALAEKAADGKGGAKGTAALNLVKRWFADPATSLPVLKTYIATLQSGFKNMVKLLNRGQLILTDWVPLRTATTQAEINFLNSEAFTFSSHGEGLDVVYIERSFFINHPGNVLKGLKNWTRILVHELTHLECGTTDVNNGNARYAWYGIGPHAGYPGSDCIRNADNWAFFCADCAGQLTTSERNTALKII